MEEAKVYYVTYGAGQHFKNKSNFQNLLFHEKDFGVLSEWHFYATAHGKGACDGIGTNNNHISTPKKLYNWAKNYCKVLRERLEFSHATQNYKFTWMSPLDIYHSFLPINSKLL